MLSISPHTTACLYNPRLSLPVRKPSLPATRSLQSRVISCSSLPALAIWCGFNPNNMHFPTLFLTSESHLGLNEAVAGSPGVSCALVFEDVKRICVRGACFSAPPARRADSREVDIDC